MLWTGGCLVFLFFFFQAEDGIRDLVRSRGLGDVYKRQGQLLFDSQSRSLSLVFDLKQKAEIKIQDVEGTKDTSKLVIDLSLIHI